MPGGGGQRRDERRPGPGLTRGLSRRDGLTLEAAAGRAPAGPKQIEVYPFNGHDGGGTEHFLAKLAFLGSLPGRPDPRPA